MIPSIDARITVTAIQGDKVRLGITAPRVIDVHRQEVYEAIRQAAAQQDAVAAWKAARKDGLGPDGAA